MNRLFKLLIALSLVVLTAPAFAQNPVPAYVSADDGGVAMLVKYFPGVSTNSNATIAVVQGTSLTFEVGSAAYTGFECPVSGALGGVIDETNAACNTMGEIVDIINGTAESFSTGFFRAVLLDSLRTDSADDLLALGAAQATLGGGIAVNYDTSANFAVGETRALVPISCRSDINCFVTPAGKLIENPWGGTRTTINWVEGKSTYGSGTSVLNVYSVKPKNKASGAETVTTLWSEAMGATATNKQFTQFQNVPLKGKLHEKVVVRATNSAAQASVTLLVSAEQDSQ